MYKVMLIDDEKWVVKSLKNSIDWHSLGFEIVAEAFNGEEGYDKIKRLTPDLVFTDIRMPGMDGLEVMRKSNELNRNISFIITSGYKEFEYAKKAIQYGALEYCLKPFDEEEITDILVKYSRNRPVKKASDELLALLQQHDAGDMKPYIEELMRRLGIASDKTAGQPSPQLSTFHKIVAFVDEHFREDISLQVVSEKLDLNLSYISQLFRKEGSDTFLQYLTKKRMAYACELLVATQTPVQEISELAGYMDYFHFAKTFKRSIGLTATQYREAYFNSGSRQG